MSRIPPRATGGFKPMLRLLNANLTDVTVIRTGPHRPEYRQAGARQRAVRGDLVVGSAATARWLVS
jgi:hypothetical protein